MSTMTLNDFYRTLVVRVFERIVIYGFKKRGVLYYRDNSETRAAIQFQKSRRSTSELSLFTINISVICIPLLDPEIDDLKKMGGNEGHMRWRLGDFLDPPFDKWWELKTTTDIAALADELASLIIDHVIPLLDKYSKMNSIIQLWDSGASPGISEMQRNRYLAELEDNQQVNPSQ